MDETPCRTPFPVLGPCRTSVFSACATLVEKNSWTRTSDYMSITAARFAAPYRCVSAAIYLLRVIAQRHRICCFFFRCSIANKPLAGTKIWSRTKSSRTTTSPILTVRCRAEDALTFLHQLTLILFSFCSSTDTLEAAAKKAKVSGASARKLCSRVVVFPFCTIIIQERGQPDLHSSAVFLVFLQREPGDWRANLTRWTFVTP